MPNQIKEICLMCDCDALNYSTEKSTFKFGIGKKKDTIHAVIPILTCNKCGFSFTSEEGNNAEHNAVCAHLERLNPTEILSLREKLELTQEQFGKLTKFNSSSIHRWETGEKIQNASSDQLLQVINKLYLMFGNAAQTIDFLKTDEKMEQSAEEKKDTRFREFWNQTSNSVTSIVNAGSRYLSNSHDGLTRCAS